MENTSLQKLSWQIDTPPVRTFRVEVKDYERYVGAGTDTHVYNLTATSLPHLFYKLRGRSSIEYYLPNYFEDMTPEEKQEFKELSDEEAAEMLDEQNGDGGDYFNIIETTGGVNKVWVGSSQAAGEDESGDEVDDWWTL